MLTFLIGGARSGKSTLALRLAADHAGPVTFVATAPRIHGDDDLAARIEHHRAERPGHWSTVEEELDLAGAIRRAGPGLVVVDCLTVWVGNLVHHGARDEAVLGATDDASGAIAARDGDAIVISNEVGLGIVPGEAETRRYRDLLGRVNQRLAAAADQPLLVVAGMTVALQSGGAT